MSIESLNYMIYNFKKFLFYKNSISNKAFLSFLAKKRLKYPLVIDFDITSKCNFKCDFCYFKERLNTLEDVNFETVQKLIISLKKGTYLFLGGGEPLLRKDLLDVICLAKEQNLRVGLCTNGYYLDGTLLENLKKAEIDDIYFSIYGDKTAYENTTHVFGAYDKVLKNLKMLSKIKHWKTKIYITSTITEKTLPHIHKIINMGRGLKINRIKFEHLNFLPTEKKDEYIEILKRIFDKVDYPKPMSYIRDFFDLSFLKDINKISNDLIKFFPLDMMIKPFLNEKELSEWYCGMESKKLKRMRCSYVLFSTYVASDGYVHPCQFYDYKLGNIKEKSIYEIWNSRKYEEFRSVVTKQILPSCYRCCKL